MKRLISYCLSLSLLFMIPVANADDSKTKLQLLFVMRAEVATISIGQKGLELTLTGIDPKTIYFSDRPERKAGFMTTEKFMESWIKLGSSFQKDPPNASIVFDAFNVDKSDVAHAVVVELKNPVESGAELKFQLKDLEGKISTGSYKNAIVFVDEWPWHNSRGQRVAP